MNHRIHTNNRQSGAAMMGIVLIIVVILIAMVGALSIGPQLQRITYERQTVKRANAIVDAMRQYYLARGELPEPGSVSVPVNDLNLEQRHKFDAWGQEWFYRKGGTITDLTVNGQQVAGVLISGGPDQQLQTDTAIGTTAFSSDPSNDDIVIPINVQAEAIQIAKDELEILTKKQEVYCISCEAYWPTDGTCVAPLTLTAFVNHFGLRDLYATGPWGADYAWNSSLFHFELTSTPVGSIRGRLLPACLPPPPPAGFPSTGSYDDPGTAWYSGGSSTITGTKTWVNSVRLGRTATTVTGSGGGGGSRIVTFTAPSISFEKSFTIGGSVDELILEVSPGGSVIFRGDITFSSGSYITVKSSGAYPVYVYFLESVFDTLTVTSIGSFTKETSKDPALGLDVVRLDLTGPIKIEPKTTP